MASKLRQIETFCLAYEHRSLTAAARIQGMTPQSASRALAALEAELGAQLLRRNTRLVEPTEAGRTYYEACRVALGALEEAEARLVGAPGAPAGVVRISVPTTYGHHRFMPSVGEFRRKYPQVELDVEVSNRNIDFVREGFDLAVRMGELEDASFAARRLGDFSLGIFASPAYLAERGEPQNLDEAREHECAVFVMPRTGRPLPWAVQINDQPETWAPPAAVCVRDDVQGLVTFARAGGGLVQMYHYLVEKELERGELVEVLTAYRGCSRPFSLIYPPQAAKRPAVRALIDFIVATSARDRLGDAARSRV